MGQGFHDFIDFNVEAEALGYHSTFLVEHHFTGWNQVSATLTLLTGSRRAPRPCGSALP
jgi:alkanesulfonate monooxygenase SsuD/methylene tetrahydromethanopterin reductase-like flavin-dependent oxidoreductase (luciferase family)